MQSITGGVAAPQRLRHLSGTRIRPQRLHELCVEAMRRAGMRESDARTTADVLVTTDTWGTFTHGTKHLCLYLRKLRAGGIDGQAVPAVVRQGPAWGVVDGCAAMAMVSACAGMELAIQKARACGIGYVGVRNSTHFGAAGYYASLALPHHMIGLAMSNADLGMTAPGARAAIIGNNPMAYAVPAGQERPVMLDMAMSTVAASKIYVAQALGKSIPDNWLVDEDGLPTTDISRYPQVGALQPAGGHKGYGLAVLVEVLAAVLSGASITAEVNSWLGQLALPNLLGHAFVAIDVDVIMPIAEFEERMERFVRRIHESPKAKGAERIYLPGEMEWERRAEALEQGIALPDDVWANLIVLAEEAGLDPEVLRQP